MLKAKAKPEVHERRRPQNSEVHLKQGNSDDRHAFAAKIKKALEDSGTIWQTRPRMEVRDLD